MSIDNIQSILKDSSQNKTHIIFDFDGTVALLKMDWSGWHTGAQKIYSQFELNSSRGSLNAHIFYNIMAKKYGSELVEELKIFNRNYERDHLQGINPNTELINLITTNSNKKMFLYSSNSRSTISKVLTQLNLENSFEKIVTRDDVDFVKPNPEGFYLLHDEKISKDRYLMIGDTSADEGMAQAAEIDYCFVGEF